MKNFKVKKLIIPAAGFGTRMLPQTKAIPKEMFPLIDKPVIQYIVEEAISAGIKEIIIITNSQKRAIEDHFNRSIELEKLLEKKKEFVKLNEIKNISQLVKINFVRQIDGYGTAMAIASAEKHLNNEPFAVLWSDIIADGSRLKQAINVSEKYNSSVICGQIKKQPEDRKKYGFIKGVKIEKNIWKVNRLIEKPDKKITTDIAVLNGYVLTPDIFEIIRKLPKNSKGEYCLIDAIDKLCRVKPVYGVELVGINQYDTGDKFEYLKTIVEYGIKDNKFGKDFLAYLKEKV